MNSAEGTAPCECAGVPRPSKTARNEQPAPGRCARHSLDSRSNPQPDCPACGARNDYTKVLYASGAAQRAVNFYCKVCQLCWSAGGACGAVQPGPTARGSKRSFQSAAGPSEEGGAPLYAPLATHPLKALLPTSVAGGSAASSAATNSVMTVACASGSDNAPSSAWHSGSSAGIRSSDGLCGSACGARGSGPAAVPYPAASAPPAANLFSLQSDSDMQTGSAGSNSVGAAGGVSGAQSVPVQQNAEFGLNNAAIPASAAGQLQGPAIASRHAAGLFRSQARPPLPEPNHQVAPELPGPPAGPPAWQYHSHDSRAAVSDSHMYHGASSIAAQAADTFAAAGQRAAFVESHLAPPTWARPRGALPPLPGTGRAALSAPFTELRPRSPGRALSPPTAAALLGLPQPDTMALPLPTNATLPEWRSSAAFGAPAWATLSAPCFAQFD